MKQYSEYIKNEIEAFPYKITHELSIENRGNIVLYIKGKIIFENYSELYIKEYIVISPKFQKIAYSYHYQDENKNLIFRYDNVQHYTFSHHKHINNKVLPSKEPCIEEILKEILNYLERQI